MTEPWKSWTALKQIGLFINEGPIRECQELHDTVPLDNNNNNNNNIKREKNLATWNIVPDVRVEPVFLVCEQIVCIIMQCYASLSESI